MSPKIMNLSEVQKYLATDWNIFKTFFEEALVSDVSLLNDINKKIISNSGKQLRPMLAILAAKACAPRTKLSKPTFSCAAAAEIIHNATLLHDDVVDNSPCRRDKPTIFSRFGAGVAVLVGDYWLSRAIELIMASECSDKIITLFSKTISDLVQGEIFQLQKSELLDTSLEDYYKIIYGKTASLFESAIISGALSVNAPSEYVDALGKYAVFLGYAFQIKDDIFDYTPDAKVGKNIGVDILEKKITLPLLGALVNAPKYDKVLRDKIRDIDNNKEEILEFINENKGVEYAYSQLDLYVDKAVTSLVVLPDTKEKEFLIKLAKFVGDRNK